MVDPIRRVRRVQGVKAVSSSDPVESGQNAASHGLNLPVPAGPIKHHESPPQSPEAAAAFAAQILSGGERRGLKGGPSTLAVAKGQYLGAQWSGPHDRRSRKGSAQITDV